MKLEIAFWVLVAAFIFLIAVTLGTGHLKLSVNVTDKPIDPPRCAKVKCTVTRDTVWVIGEPMPEKDLDCKCLVEEQK